MDANWEEFSARVRSALEEQVEGSSEAFKALWSKRDDVSIMGADGALDQGWEDVSTGIDWAARIIQASERSLENKVTIVGEDLAMTVDIETVKKTFGNETRTVSLRCTQVYRVEDGDWRIVLRHADEFAPKGPRLAEQPAGVGPPTAGGFPGGPPGGGPPGGGPPGGGPPGGGPPGGPPGGGPPGRGGPPGGGPPGGGPP